MTLFLSWRSINKQWPLSRIADITAILIYKHDNMFTGASGMYSNVVTRMWILLCVPLQWANNWSNTNPCSWVERDVFYAECPVTGSIFSTPEKLLNSFMICGEAPESMMKWYRWKTFRHRSYPNLLTFVVRCLLPFRPTAPNNMSRLAATVTTCRGQIIFSSYFDRSPSIVICDHMSYFHHGLRTILFKRMWLSSVPCCFLTIDRLQGGHWAFQVLVIHER